MNKLKLKSELVLNSQELIQRASHSQFPKLRWPYKNQRTSRRFYRKAVFYKNRTETKDLKEKKKKKTSFLKTWSCKRNQTGELAFPNMTWQLIFRFHSLTLWTWLPRAAPTSCMEFYFWTLLHALFTIFLPILFHVSPKVLKNQNFLATHSCPFLVCIMQVCVALFYFFQIFLTRDVFSINKYSKLEKLLQINEKCTPQDIISNNWISIFKFRKKIRVRIAQSKGNFRK